MKLALSMKKNTELGENPAREGVKCKVSDGKWKQKGWAITEVLLRAETEVRYTLVYSRNKINPAFVHQRYMVSTMLCRMRKNIVQAIEKVMAGAVRQKEIQQVSDEIAERGARETTLSMEGSFGVDEVESTPVSKEGLNK